MVNPFHEVNWKPNTAERRKFAVSLMIGFPCLGVLLLLGRWVFAHQWAVAVSMKLAGYGFAAGLIFWLLPSIALPFYVAWYFVSCCLGIVVGNLLLVLFYYIVVTGMGLLLRILGKKPISRKIERGAASYWQDAEVIADPKRYYRQY